jgi:hypothetical protein
MAFQDISIPELINLVATKCDIHTLNKLCSVSKNMENMIDNDIKIKKIKEIIPDFLHAYIDFNSKYMLNAKNINIGDTYGMTGYIDFISLKHFINENDKTNIVYGYDNSKRFFISLLYKDILNDKNKIVTFFQRYSNEHRYFVSCQNTFIIDNSCITHLFTNSDFNTLSKIYQILFTLINYGVAKNDVDSDEFYTYELI